MLCYCVMWPQLAYYSWPIAVYEGSLGLRYVLVVSSTRSHINHIVRGLTE